MNEPTRYPADLNISTNEVYQYYELWQFYDGEWCYMGYDRVFGWTRLGTIKEKAEQYVIQDYNKRRNEYAELIKQGKI